MKLWVQVHGILIFAPKMIGPSPGFQGMLLPIFHTRILTLNSPSLVWLKSWASAALSLLESNPINELTNEARNSPSQPQERLCREPGRLTGTRHSLERSEKKVIKYGMDPDSHVWISLVNVYAKCGDRVYARQVFAEMPERDVVSWTALIQGSVAEGYGIDELDFGKQLHSESLKAGYFSDLFVGSSLVDLYTKCGAMELADSVFFCMPEQNAVSWNALLSGYAEKGDSQEVLKLFCRMRQLKNVLNNYILSAVLRGCTNGGNLRQGQVLHSLALKVGCEFDEFLGCNLVYMYSKCGLATDALKVFVRIKNPDIVACSAMITCFGQQKQWQEAAHLFRLMRCIGILGNHFSFSSILSSATDMGDLQYGESIHACVWKSAFQYDLTVSNALITMYAKIGCVQDAIRVFEAIKDCDLVSWNALLSGFHDYENCNLGPRMFRQMLVEGFKPNMYTFISILRSCSSLLDVGLGKQIHAHSIKNSLHDNVFIGTALIDMYAKTRCLKDANLAFSRLPYRDLLTWTTIITGYAQTGQAENAVSLLNQMRREGVRPNGFTLASCLNSCARIATLEHGLQLHSLAFKDGHTDDCFVNSALVDMYAKCGCIEDSETVFEGLVSRDTVSWNTMICGYSQHGQGGRGLEAFRKMLDEGTMPDETTFIGVFSACSHLGLVKEGQEHFNSMIKDFDINPTIEHYACMIGILGRAGKFTEVESLIENMKIAPQAIIWETVLGACKFHGNVEYGKRAAEKLFELIPEMDSTYILLSNIFAAKGLWDDVRNVRKLMGSQQVKKKPGSSWVEVDGQVHVFTSQDSSHPKIKEIHFELEELDKKMELVGYIPQTEYVLHKMTEKEKRKHLQHHSERLALAFALIYSPPIKAIRIFKNLRICGDCHNVMKLVSGITNREIVVRDNKLFHHFKFGSCSCKDFCNAMFHEQAQLLPWQAQDKKEKRRIQLSRLWNPHKLMGEAKKGVTKAMGQVNRQMSLPSLQKIMQEFERQNEKMEFVSDGMADAIDDALEGDEEGEKIGKPDAQQVWNRCQPREPTIMQSYFNVQLVNVPSVTVATPAKAKVCQVDQQQQRGQDGGKSFLHELYLNHVYLF
uniref:DYW domain-containing protein n=1 Tax=Cannabis sativa TaxID=3483 RepID=A0A803P2X0_CANSA